tara:strand:- start:3051 stop:3401 length:351 start_codon:yes stop_codon:yes gene_type:complete
MYEKTFYRLLESDCNCLGKEKPVTRQQRGFIGLGAKTQKLVPDVHRNDPTEHPKVEVLRQRPVGSSHRVILNAKDLKDILSQYNIKNLSPEEPRDLGTTKITIYYDGPLGRYCLSK